MFFEMEPQPHQRESGVEWIGRVPAGWQVAPGGSLFREIIDRGHPDEQMLSVTIGAGVVRQEDLLREAESKDGSNLDRSKYKLVQPGDIVYNKMRAWQGAFGRSIYRGIVSPAYIVLRSNGLLSSDFAHYVMRTPSFAREAQRWSYGITSDQWSLRPKDFKNIYFPVPPTDAQAALVEVLDRVERRLEQVLAIKRDLRRLLEEEIDGIIFRAVSRGLRGGSTKESGIGWLGEVPADWEVAPVRARYTVKLGKMLDEKRITGASLVPYLRNTDVQWDQINVTDLPQMDILPAESARYTVEPGDLLVCEGGEVGRAAIWQGDGVVGFQKALHRLRPMDATRDRPRFFYYLLRAVARRGIFRAEGGRSTISHLTAERLRRYRLPFPPAVEQEEIVEFLDDQIAGRRRLIAEVDAQVEAIREYRSRLISDVATGELTVPAGLDPDDAVGVGRPQGGASW